MAHVDIVHNAHSFTYLMKFGYFDILHTLSIAYMIVQGNHL